MLRKLLRWHKTRRPAETYPVQIDGITITVVHKAIRNINLRVSPPGGEVRVAAPFHMSEARVRAAIARRMDWIKRHRKKLEGLPCRLKREMENGESVHFMGQGYLLRITEQSGIPRVNISGPYIDIHVKAAATLKQRKEVLLEWYRQQLKTLVPPLLEKWEAVMGVHATGWGIKRMKTRWGSCNIRRHNIWLNLELAKRPLECLEGIIVHELAHLIERNHGPRFKAVMDKYSPDWKRQREMLKRPISGYED